MDKRQFIRRRQLLSALAAAPLSLLLPGAAHGATQVTVHKLSSCGCCGLWVEHLRAAGFEVTTRSVNDLDPIRAKLGVPGNLASCHTAVVDRYAIEGHVPAAEIRRLLRERPEVAGLAVPGMVPGSPGMEGPRRDPYEVLAFERNGATRVYARYR
jgi:hypothetical protein